MDAKNFLKRSIDSTEEYEKIFLSDKSHKREYMLEKINANGYVFFPVFFGKQLGKSWRAVIQDVVKNDMSRIQLQQHETILLSKASIFFGQR